MAHPLAAEVRAILAAGRDLTLATLREDGWPQATTVSYAADGLEIYFGCGSQSQKARNLARDARTSAVVGLPFDDWQSIRGLSMAARAHRVSDHNEVARARSLFLAKFPQIDPDMAQVAGGDIALFRLQPEVVSLLDYRKGFGHADLLTAADLAG